MKWYNDMSEQQKRNFKKVIVVCVVGAISILLIPMIWKFVLQVNINLVICMGYVYEKKYSYPNSYNSFNI